MFFVIDIFFVDGTERCKDDFEPTCLEGDVEIVEMINLTNKIRASGADSGK